MTESQFKKLEELIQNKRPIVVVSHPRSGTHLTIDVLRKFYIECDAWKYPTEPNNYLYLSLDSIFQTQSRLGFEYACKILSRSQAPIIKTHSSNPQYDDLGFFGVGKKSLDPRLAECLRKNARFLYVVRDCRRVMSSFHLWMSGFSEQAKQSSLSEFVRQTPRAGRNRIEQWVDHITAWKEQPGGLFVRFESLIKHPQETVEHIRSVLKLTVREKVDFNLPPKLTLLRSRINRVIGMRPVSSAILGRSRAKLQPWKDFISDQESQELLRPTVEIDRWRDLIIESD